MLKIRKREDAAAVFSMLFRSSAAGPGAMWRMGGGGERAREDKRGQGEWRREATGVLAPAPSTQTQDAGVKLCN